MSESHLHNFANLKLVFLSIHFVLYLHSFHHSTTIQHNNLHYVVMDTHLHQIDTSSVLVLDIQIDCMCTFHQHPSLDPEMHNLHLGHLMWPMYSQILRIVLFQMVMGLEFLPLQFLYQLHFQKSFSYLSSLAVALKFPYYLLL